MNELRDAVCGVCEAAAPEAERKNTHAGTFFDGERRFCTVLESKSDVTVVLDLEAPLELPDEWSGRGKRRQIRVKMGDDMTPIYKGVQLAWEADQA